MPSKTKKSAYCIATIFLLLLGSSLFAQQSVTGKVTGTDNLPIVNASVIVKGTKAGVRTDENGTFIITVPANKSVLIISSVGFKQQEINITGNTVQQIKLTVENTVLNDVVVTGYTRQSKRDVTGAASTVSADVISKTPVTDITTALQGRVAGVNVDDQGGPGNAGVIRIRGIGSLGNNDPLYVIDGVQV